LLQSAPLGLPPPAKQGAVPVEEALQNRRSLCHCANRSLNLAKTSQRLWAADGINQPQGKEIAPLGRAVSPLNLYPVVGSGSLPLFWTGNACP